ncbi:PP2C family protein-serine/threonine phosphatase [Actinophytocola sp.]|uniref:PP2C family protein-serine/threonine phosphatase n=1 Tax=Actinophytocola sp. TaxID=1872138 RepID=UPI002D7F6AB1|nr:SpoIIE family protein phosphatase [Actinophytocola sp.]HET9138830.1 SpoIIE family protein phosphatase [Actinophytocola sp.]
MTGVMFPSQLPTSDTGTTARGREKFGLLRADSDDRVNRIPALALRVLDAAGAGIAMLSPAPAVNAAAGLPAADSAEAEALARFAVSHAGLNVIEDVRPDAGLGMLPNQQPIRFYAGIPVRSPAGDPLGSLFVVDHRPRNFSKREVMLLAELKWWVERALQQSAELFHAAEVQRKLMPEQPPRVDGYEFAAACVPCRGVGGDFFDWYFTDRGVAMTLADVMGKGIGGAIVMSAACSILRGAGRQYPPAQAIEFADHALREELESTETMITVCHGELTPATGVVRYVDAGHGLMFTLLADGTVRRAPASMKSLPLGIFPDEPRPEIAMRLAPGDAAVIFSDGLLDLYDGTAASIDVIAAEAGAVLGQGAEAIVDHFIERATGKALSDDVTVCAYRRTP